MRNNDLRESCRNASNGRDGDLFYSDLITLLVAIVSKAMLKRDGYRSKQAGLQHA